MESQYWKLLITSLAVALGAACGPAFSYLRGSTGFVLIGFPLSIAWCLVVAYAFQLFKRSALWFLLAAPIALCWPFFIALVALGVLRM
jgi:hypothetical protein